MHREPFDGDPPISDEELDLEFDYDPNHDYMADVDQIQPGWSLPEVQYMPPGGTVSTGAAFSNVTGPREVLRVDKIPTGEKDKRGKEKVKTIRRTMAIPHKRFVRWVDLAGNLGPLIVSTIRPDAEAMDGDDGEGTMDRVIAKKQRRGGLILERDATNPWSRYHGNEYIAWCLAVMKYRKEKQAEYLKQEQTQWEEDQRREARARNAENAKSTGDAIGAAMKDAMKEVVAEVRGKAKADKPEKAPAQ